MAVFLCPKLRITIVNAQYVSNACIIRSIQNCQLYQSDFKLLKRLEKELWCTITEHSSPPPAQETQSPLVFYPLLVIFSGDNQDYHEQFELAVKIIITIGLYEPAVITGKKTKKQLPSELAKPIKLNISTIVVVLSGHCRHPHQTIGTSSPSMLLTHTLDLPNSRCV